MDVNGSLEAPRPRTRLEVDAEKAGLPGASVALVAETLAGPSAGRDVSRLADGSSREPVPVRVRLSAADRASLPGGSPSACPLPAVRWLWERWATP